MPNNDPKVSDSGVPNLRVERTGGEVMIVGEVKGGVQTKKTW